MKIQQMPNGEIQVTFRPDEIANFQTALPLEEIPNEKRFENCLSGIHFKTRDFLNDLRNYYGVGNSIKRTDKKVNEIRFKNQITDVSKVLKFHENTGLISVKRINENNDTTSKILTFKFNF
jgi:hypothetical protein